MGGVARRAWARNEAAMETAAVWNAGQASVAPGEPVGHITMPNLVEEGLPERLVERSARLWHDSVTPRTRLQDFDR